MILVWGSHKERPAYRMAEPEKRAPIAVFYEIISLNPDSLARGVSENHDFGRTYFVSARFLENLWASGVQMSIWNHWCCYFQGNRISWSFRSTNVTTKTTKNGRTEVSLHRDIHVNNYTPEELFTGMKMMNQSERRFGTKPDVNFDVSIRIAIKEPTWKWRKWGQMSMKQH